MAPAQPTSQANNAAAPTGNFVLFSQAVQSNGEMFFYRNGYPRTDPVARDGKKILKDVEQVVAPCHGADQLNQRDNYTQSPTGDRFCVTAQNLEGQRGSVGAECVVGNGSKGKDYNAEPTEAAETVIAG
ncbi:MAG: hypothetical protein Q9167_000513 [Letrouitia subvulpina]